MLISRVVRLSMSTRYIGSIDQGTTSTRFLLFEAETLRCVFANDDFPVVPVSTRVPVSGWAEQCPNELWNTVQKCFQDASVLLGKMKIDKQQIMGMVLVHLRDRHHKPERNNRYVG